MGLSNRRQHAVQLTLYGGILITAPPTTGLISHFLIQIGLKLGQGHFAILVAVVGSILFGWITGSQKIESLLYTHTINPIVFLKIQL